MTTTTLNNAFLTIMGLLPLPWHAEKKPQTRKNLEITPITKAAIAFFGTALTLASAIAIFKLILDLAPDYAERTNLAIIIHVITVLPCVPLGAYLLLAPKGTPRHKMLGKVWLALMVTTAIAITFVRGGTDFSWIHIFVPYTLVGSWKVIATARRGDIVAHKSHLVGMYLGALVIPGLFSFLPTRIMGLWLFG